MLPYGVMMNFPDAVGADSISARAILRCRKFPRANNVRPYTIRNARHAQNLLIYERPKMWYNMSNTKPYT